jgi:ketosteroid isomerase-like protein
VTSQTQAPGAAANAGHPADTRYATADLTALLFEYFGAKSAHDIDATHSFFHPDKVQYFDATLGWEFRSNAALKGEVWDQYMPMWPPTAKSYATKVIGDITGAIVFMTDTPELFGAEIRALGVVDFENGKIVRWVDYWDGRHFGSDTAAQMRVPAETYPADLGVDTVEQGGTPDLRDVINRLAPAFSAHDADAVAALFDDDAVFEDLTLRTSVRGRTAISRYLRRALDVLPYASATVAHIVGGDSGGGYEWRTEGAHVPRGAIALTLDHGRITQLTAIWDGALLGDEDLRTAVLKVISQ